MPRRPNTRSQRFRNCFLRGKSSRKPTGVAGTQSAFALCKDARRKMFTMAVKHFPKPFDTDEINTDSHDAVLKRQPSRSESPSLRAGNCRSENCPSGGLPIRLSYCFAKIGHFEIRCDNRGELTVVPRVEQSEQLRPNVSCVAISVPRSSISSRSHVIRALYSIVASSSWSGSGRKECCQTPVTRQKIEPN